MQGAYSHTQDSNHVGVVEMVGFFALCGYLFALFSASLDLVPGIRSIRPSLMMAAIGLTVVGISGRLSVILQHRICRMLIGLSIWFVICVPLSVWPGGSVKTLTDEWNIALLTFFLAAGLLGRVDQCVKAVHVLCYGGFVLSLLTLKINTLSREGRLILPNTRYMNPNDLALVLVTVLPLVVYMGLRQRSGFRRLIALAGVPTILLVIAKAGSRGALIGLGVAMLVVFWRVSMAKKVGIVAVSAAGLLAATMVLPESTATRLFTIFGDDKVNSQTDDVTVASIHSAYSRKMLLMDSITLTIRNPLFGVGPGMFSVAQNDLAVERGDPKGNWHVTHNSYTQVSSESGLPGLALFLLAIAYSFKSLGRISRMQGSPATRDDWEDLRGIASTMQIALVGLLVCSFFASVAYLPFFTCLAGLTVGMEYCADRLRSQTQQPMAVPLRSGKFGRSRMSVPPQLRPSPQKA